MGDNPISLELTQPGGHLSDLFIIHQETQERVCPDGSLTKLDNDLFEGEMMLMIRPPDLDQSIHNDSDDVNPVAKHFLDKQHLFEFQWQLKLKKIPAGEVYMGCEIDEPTRLGMIQRALLNAMLQLVKTANQGFTYFISDSDECFSYMAFPVGTSMDRFVTTKPGGTLPELGTELMEDEDMLMKRANGEKIDWNTEDVYTMALWSPYFDWTQWQFRNFPGIPSFSATSITGPQPIRLTLYTTPSEVSHVPPQEIGTVRELVLALELSNASKSSLGSMATMWQMKQSLSEKDDVVDNNAVQSSCNDVSPQMLVEQNKGSNIESSICSNKANNVMTF